MTACGFLIAYAFVGCVYWLWMLVGTCRVVRAVPMLERASPPLPQEWPRLSVIIPACNEAATLEAALSSVLRQVYPDLEIILIDDRSTDGTAEIVDRMAANDPRIIACMSKSFPKDGLARSTPWTWALHGRRLVAAMYRCRRSLGSWHAASRDRFCHVQRD